MSDQLKPRRTWMSNTVWRLPGGNEDNDLWAYNDPDGRVISIWVPTDEQRARIAEGANIELHVWGGMPPVALVLNDRTPLGAPPENRPESHRDHDDKPEEGAR